MVNSTKTITKAIADGKVEITAADLGTDKASDWTVLEVFYGGNKMMTGVTSTDDKITVTLDDAGSAFSGDVVVTLTYEAAMNITEDAQQPPVVVQGAMVDADGIFIGKAIDYTSVRIVGTDADFSALTNGSNMFNSCSNLSSFTSDMPALTNGEEMFRYCYGLASFSGDLSALTNGEGMFGSCSYLSSFSGDLSALTTGSYMFYYCESLTSFTSDMPALTDGSSMFCDCSSLTSFSGDLSALTNGEHMFSDCRSLTSFSGDLSALTDGIGMFYGCKLDKESVNRIANSLPSVDYGDIDIGVDENLVTEEDIYAVEEIIAGKGWTVYWERN